MKSCDGEFLTAACDGDKFYMTLAVCILLIFMAGMMAGLTMGLLSIEKLNLTIQSMEGSEVQKRQALRVLSIIKNRHFLLVTLLLVNAGANEALPVFLSRLVDEKTAIIISVTCVLLFGEIIPTAVFSGPNQINIASKCVPFVTLLMMVCSPIAYPVGKLLDFVLSDDHDMTRYKRSELKALVGLQREQIEMKKKIIRQNQSLSPSQQGVLTPMLQRDYPLHGTMLNIDEVTIIHGALDLATKSAKQIMIPFDEVFMLQISDKLDNDLMATIMASGHSRIPICSGDRRNILGVLMVKRMIVLDPEDERPISDLSLRRPIVVHPEYSCYALLNEFQKGKSHIAFLTKQHREVNKKWKTGVGLLEALQHENIVIEGIVTMEDVLEELIQEEIEDESDIQLQSSVLDKWSIESRRIRLRDAGLRKAVRVFRQIAIKVKRRRQNNRLNDMVNEKNRLSKGSSGDVQIDMDEVIMKLNSSSNMQYGSIESQPLIAQ